MPNSTQITRHGMPLATRSAQFRAASFDPVSRTITVSLGTGAPVDRYDYRTGTRYTEILSMDPASVRLERLTAGGPLLVNHDHHDVEAVVGRFVKNSVTVAGGELVGQVRLSKAARNADTVGDIVDGILTDTSVGYVVHAWVIEIAPDGAEVRTATDWEPLEGSIVGIPADPTGGVRSASTDRVPTAPDAPAAADSRSNQSINTETNTMDANELIEARAAGARLECERQNQIRAIASRHGLTAIETSDLMTSPTLTVQDAGLRVLDLLATRAAAAPEVHAVVTADEGDATIRAIESRLEQKAGASRDLPASANQFRGASLVDLAAARLRMSGVNVVGRTRSEIASMAIRAVASHTSSDFPILLANVANKVLVAAFQNAPDYRWYEKIGTRDDWSDYKARSFANLMGFGVLPTVTEGGEYTGISGADVAESGTLVKKGADLRLTKEMVANDDLGAFARSVSEFGLAAVRTCSAISLAALQAQVCGDGDAIYHANHHNLVSSGAAPSAATLAVLDGLLRAQTDGNGAVVGMGAQYLFAPAALRATIEGAYSPNFVVDSAAAAMTVAIAPENRIYIPGHAATKWEVGNGDPTAFVYGFLGEEGGPVVTQYPSYVTDSVVYHGTMSFAAVVTKWQAFAQNSGTGG